MDKSTLVKVTKRFTLHLVICYLSSVYGQNHGYPYPSTSINRYGYRFGNALNFGLKYNNPYNGQYSDPNRQPMNPPAHMTDHNNYWKINPQGYPPSAYPSSQPFPPSSASPPSPFGSSPGLPSHSLSMPPPPPSPSSPSSSSSPSSPTSTSSSSSTSPSPSSSSSSSSSPPSPSPSPSSSSSSSPSSSLSSSGVSQYSPFNSQSQIPSQPFLSASPFSDQPPLAAFEAKYDLPGPANFADSTATFDNRLGWVPRYPNFVFPPSYYFPTTGHPYSYHRNRIARAIADIRGSENKITGSISFEQEDNNNVIIRGKILGLPPGAHGMHILEKPLTGNDCTSAADHYNPQKTEHGGKHDWVRHIGDLGNIFADRDGVTYFDLNDQIISLIGGYSILNRTIVITEKPDDLGRSSDPESKRTGNSGPAIACGLIQLTKY